MEMLINARCLEGKRTGVGRYLANLLEIWSERHVEDIFHLYFKDGFSGDASLNCDNVKSHLAAAPSGLNLGPIWENYYLPRALNKNDSAGTYFSPLYTLPAYPVNRTKVVTIFDISYVAHPEWFPFRNRAPMQILTGPTVRGADLILTGSEATKAEILKFYDIDESKISVTNLGVDPSFIQLNNRNHDELVASVKSKYNLVGKVVLFLGLIMNRRNLPAIMEAVSALVKSEGEQVTLLVVGKNHTFPYFDVEELASKFGITENLRWVTYTDDQEIFAFYKAADVFMCASMYEGFNITPLESIFLGTPVICSNLSSLPEVVGDAAYFLNDPEDPLDIQLALERVLFDDGRQRTLIAAGEKQASQFSWERCASETMELIKHVS